MSSDLKNKSIDKSKLTFQKESIEDVWDEFIRLGGLHWDETEQFHQKPLNANKELYFHYSKIGYHLLYTIRYEGVYIGHAGMYYTPSSMHSGAAKATEDLWFIEKEYRGVFFKDFYLWVESKLKELDVKEVSITTKITNLSGNKAALKMGYELVSNEYIKRI